MARMFSVRRGAIKKKNTVRTIRHMKSVAKYLMLSCGRH